jgi:hypothetical protein
MIELELKARTELDGTSTVASDDEEKTHRRRSRESRGQATADYGDEDSEASEAFDLPARKRRRDANANANAGAPRARQEEDDEEAMAGAAFGIGGAGGALSVVHSDTDDSVSVTSSAVRESQRRAFPIQGVHCVGCAMPTKVTAVDDFVRTSCDKMTDTALYKMAALVYVQKVVEPADKEGVPAPDWTWKDIRSHYTLHRIDPRMQRLESIRSLTLMRKTLEMQLLKEDEESGERTLDHGNTEKMLKVTQQLSREISLLTETSNAKK